MCTADTHDTVARIDSSVAEKPAKRPRSHLLCSCLWVLLHPLSPRSKRVAAGRCCCSRCCAVAVGGSHSRLGKLSGHTWRRCVACVYRKEGAAVAGRMCVSRHYVVCGCAFCCVCCAVLSHSATTTSPPVLPLPFPPKTNRPTLTCKWWGQLCGEVPLEVQPPDNAAELRQPQLLVFFENHCCIRGCHGLQHGPMLAGACEGSKRPVAQLLLPGEGEG